MSTSIALVTGANRGLGLETANQLAQRGYAVILTGRSQEKGERALASLDSNHYDVRFHVLDVTNLESIQTLATYIETEFGQLDVLVNNAGIHYDTGHRASNPNWTIVQEATETNFLGAWKVAASLVPLLKKSGQGRIVNVSSGAGSFKDGSPGTPAYSASKAAMNMLTIQLASELKADGILVNSVCPGWVRTDMGGQAAPRSVAEGASGIVWAATLDDNGPSGGFFRDGKSIEW